MGKMKINSTFKDGEKKSAIILMSLYIFVSTLHCNNPLNMETPKLEPAVLESEPSNYPINLLENGHFELGYNEPAAWCAKIIGYNDYEISWATEQYISPNHSIKLKLDTLRHSDSFSFWKQSITFGIPIQIEFVLTAFIKLENIIGNGVAIAVRCDDELRPSGVAEAFFTTQGSYLLAGTEDWDQYTITTTDIPTNTKSMTVYLIFLPQTTGTVYFDNISLNMLRETD